MFKIFNADCLVQIPKLKAKSIDLVVVDLPYGQTNCHWDSLIDLDKMWIELKKVCKDNCIYAFFCTVKFGASIINSNPRWFRYDLVWEKSNAVGFLSVKNAPLRNHEMIYIFSSQNGRDIENKLNLDARTYAKGVLVYIGKTSKQIEKDMTDRKAEHFFRHATSQFSLPTKKTYDKLNELYNLEKMEGYLPYDELVKLANMKKTYNPQMTKGKAYKTKSVKKKTVYGDITASAIDNKAVRYPVSILKFPYDKEKLHPTQKPVKLCEWLIKTYSNKGDVVLDFTMGSASTGIACINTERIFIGIEKDNKIFKTAKKRLNTLK